MNKPRTRSPIVRHGVLALTAILVVACGGDDADTADDPPAPVVDDDTATDGADSALADNDARESILDAVDDDSDVDSAIASLSPDTRYGIVAGQLDPEPDVVIDGTSIQLVFDDGTVTNAFMDCILASAIQSADETVTLVYPDGEKVC